MVFLRLISPHFPTCFVIVGTHVISKLTRWLGTFASLVLFTWAPMCSFVGAWLCFKFCDSGNIWKTSKRLSQTFPEEFELQFWCEIWEFLTLLQIVADNNISEFLEPTFSWGCKNIWFLSEKILSLFWFLLKLFKFSLVYIFFHFKPLLDSSSGFSGLFCIGFSLKLWFWNCRKIMLWIRNSWMILKHVLMLPVT